MAARRGRHGIFSQKQRDLIMAFDLKGFRRIAQGPTIGTGRNSTYSKYMYVTNDDLSQVTTAGYFNSLVTTAGIQVIRGDQVDATLDVDGTIIRIDFIFDSVTATTVSIKRAGTVGAGD
jgi:hypothetical protein